jgi:hypothetical protein
VGEFIFPTPFLHPHYCYCYDYCLRALRPSRRSVFLECSLRFDEASEVSLQQNFALSRRDLK